MTDTLHRISDIDDLRARIREHGEDTPDPGEVAAKILAEVDGEEAMVIAHAALRNYVRNVLAHPLKHPATDPVAYKTADGRETVSAKTAARMDWLAATLWQPMNVAADQWKRLGECGVADLDYVILLRREQAAATAAEADRWQRLRDALVEHRVDAVELLPREVAEPILSH